MNHARFIRTILDVAILAFTTCAVAAPGTPIPTPVTESVEKRLVQLDVAVEGDPDAIAGITASDFALYVGEHEIQGLIVDRLCGDLSKPPESPTPDNAAQAPNGPLPAPRPRGSFVFFFDQPHLTMAGRALSLHTSRELVNRLIVDGAQASIVSNARRLETIVSMTGDRAALLAGLERVRNDFKQWDSYSETEPRRAAAVLDPLYCSTKLARARVYAREEWQAVRRTTERLGFTVSALADLQAPKGVVYFGDTLRQRAGRHYFQLVASQCDVTDEMKSAELTPSAAAEFDAAISQALASGVHLYTVQAEGLLAYNSGWDSDRHKEAQNALVGLAAETGGEAFLGGASNKYIADRIEKVTTCRLLLSFPPGDLPRDKPLGVTLELHVPNVKIRPQGRIVVPSPESIERARMLAAFVDPASADDGSLRVLLIPRGGDGKTWKASVQLRLRPNGRPNGSAELGASIVRKDRVTDHFAASIATRSGTREKVLEKSLDIAPGEFWISAVARDDRAGDVGSRRLDASWPNPAKGDAAIAPIAALQSGAAAISKDGNLDSSGLLARELDELLDPASDVSLRSVVCRGGKPAGAIVVERWIEDGSSSTFPEMSIEQTAEPCIQVVDVVTAGRLRPGTIDYRIVARVGEEIVAQERRTLRIGN